MDLLIEIDNSVKTRELSTRSVLESAGFFASVLNLLILRGQYRLPQVASIEEAQLATLVSDFLAAAAEHFPEKGGYTVDHARSFLLEHARKPIALNPHCNQPEHFEPSPAIDFLNFLGIPVFHSILADPAEAFALRSELERHGTWANVSRNISSSPDLTTLATLLRTRPLGLTPAFAAALESLPKERRPSFALYYNAATGDYVVLAFAPRTQVPLAFHYASLDADGVVTYEHVSTAAANGAVARQFTDEAFNPLPVHNLDGTLYVDLSFREQADKDYAIALAMEDQAAFDRARDHIGYDVHVHQSSMVIASQDGTPTGFIIPAHLRGTRTSNPKKKDKLAKSEVSGEEAKEKVKKKVKLFGLFSKKKDKAVTAEE